MKNCALVFCLIFASLFACLSGCSKQDSFATVSGGEKTGNPIIEESIDPQSSESLRILLGNVIENNLFYNISAFDGCVLKSIINSSDKENRLISYTIQMMDIYGKKIADYTVTTDDAYGVTTLTATEDGGFLFVLGFSDYAYDQDTWASDKGFASRIIKCGSQGMVQFDVSLDGVEGSALEYCMEKNGKYYFFGQYQTPDTKNRGVYSPTDIFMAVLNQDGKLLNRKYIAGSDYDSLDFAEKIGDTFTLSISSQSNDGDFSGGTYSLYAKDWVITVDDDLSIVEKKLETGRDYFDKVIGVKNGEPIYSTDPVLEDFDAGWVRAYLDYGDFYLIISERNTGEYENTPGYISSIWYYTETVYSAYDYNGELIFRDAVDSSPDYDSIVENMMSESVLFTD